MSIFTKLISLTTATVLALVTALLLMGYFLISNYAEETANQQLDIDHGIVQNEIDRSFGTFISIANILTANPDFIDAVRTNDTNKLQEYGRNLVKEQQIDFITITDTQGVVIARGHNDQAGDNILADRPSLQAALKGNTVTGIEAGKYVKLTMAACIPIKHQGQIIGAVIIGEDLSNGNLINDMKQKLNVECTIFLDDIRVATTVMRDGKPATGTPLNNDIIYNKVIEKGESALSNNIILGQDYNSIYWPWQDFEGNNKGILFVGLSHESIKTTQQSVIFGFLATGAVLGIIMITIGVVVSKAISNPLRRATAYANEVASGNFEGTLDVKSKDEVGILAHALQRMVETIKDKIIESEQRAKESERQAAAAQLATDQAKQAAAETHKKQAAMLEIAQAIEDVGKNLTNAVSGLSSYIKQATNGAEVQQFRVSETSTSMGEVNQATQEVARKAAETSEISDHARDQAQEGAKMVSQVINSIRNVEEKTMVLKNAMNSLGEQAKGIDQVMTVITDIADQTNLLALNAAIEAARAGEAGRGFAVVADEVRKLAEKTMEATKEVGSTIFGIQKSVGESIDVVDESATLIIQTTDLSINSGEALNKIVDLITESSDQIQAIAAAAEEQSASSENINETFLEVANISSQTASAMEQSALAVNGLAEQEQALQSLIARLKE